jgi:hypothetical protein
MPQRYKRITVDGRQLPLHRYVMECHVGRRLRTDEIVHHINHDPFDNRLENLEIVTQGWHADHHNTKHAKTKECASCGRAFTPAPTKRERAQTCSRECFKALASVLALERAKSPEYRAKLSAAAMENGTAERAKTLVLHRWEGHVKKQKPSAVCSCGCGESFVPHKHMGDEAKHFQRGHSRKAACSKGHPFDAENTYTDPRGKRRCRACRSAYRVAAALGRAVAEAAT